MATHKIYIDRKMVFDEGVTWTTVPGLYPDAYVPEVALADAQAEIARLTADLSLWISRAEKAEAERDAARAELAMAFEVAGDEIGSMDPTCAMLVYELAPSDAKAALEARDRATREQALRDAADCLKHHLTTEQDAALANIWIESILDLADSAKPEMSETSGDTA